MIGERENGRESISVCLKQVGIRSVENGRVRIDTLCAAEGIYKPPSSCGVCPLRNHLKRSFQMSDGDFGRLQTAGLIAKG